MHSKKSYFVLKARRSKASSLALMVLATSLMGIVAGSVPFASAEIENPCPFMSDDNAAEPVLPTLPDPPSPGVEFPECPPIIWPYDVLVLGTIVRTGYPYITDMGEIACYFPFDFQVVTALPPELVVSRSVSFGTVFDSGIGKCVTIVTAKNDELFATKDLLSESGSVSNIASGQWKSEWGLKWFAQSHTMSYTYDGQTFSLGQITHPANRNDFCYTDITNWEKGCAISEFDRGDAGFTHRVHGTFWNQWPVCWKWSCLFKVKLSSMSMITDITGNFHGGEHCQTTFKHNWGLANVDEDSLHTSCDNRQGID